MSRHTTTRLARATVLYLLLGLVATWAVAWGSAVLWRPATHTLFLVEEESPSRVAVRRECFAGCYMWFAGGVDAATADELIRGSDKLVGWMGRDELLSASDDEPWEFAAVRAGLSFHRGIAAAEARGWPCAAVRCYVHEEPEGPWSEGAIELRANRPAANRAMGAILLPFLPYWTGLLADTLFYAVLFAGLHQLAGFTMRARRRKRGRCAGCGYDLQGLDSSGACPECGRATC